MKDLREAAALAGERETLLAWQKDVEHAPHDSAATVTVRVTSGSERYVSVAWDASRREAKEAVQARLDAVEARLKALGATP